MLIGLIFASTGLGKTLRGHKYTPLVWEMVINFFTQYSIA